MPFSARVLVFDQGESQPLAIDSLLKDNGYRPFVAETLDEATAIVGKARPDVAIYNSTTDGSDNADTIQSLKDHWRAEHMPLIVVGEDPEGERRTADIDNGMADFLSRPVNKIELFSRLTSLVRLNKMQEEIARRHTTAQKFGVEAPRSVEFEARTPRPLILILGQDGADTKALAKAYSGEADVNVAGDAYAAMDYLLGNPCDALIVTVTADRSDVLIFCEDVRRNSRLYNLPMIVVAAPAASADLSSVYGAGANEFLLLPVHEAELRIRTRALIRQSEYRSAMRSVFHQARTAMTSDGLTGLYSYGFLHEHLSSLIEDAELREKNLSVGFFDMKGIAYVNTNLGYIAGDRLLRQIGTLIGNLVRGEDVIGRYSGDQFCVLLPETSLAESEPALHRIAGVITNTEFAVPEVDEPLQVTMKAGIAAHEPGDTPKKLITRARDRATIV